MNNVVQAAIPHPSRATGSPKFQEAAKSFLEQLDATRIKPPAVNVQEVKEAGPDRQAQAPTIKRHHRTFSPEFRREVAVDFIRSGKPSRAIARKYGVSHTSVSNWVRQYMRDGASVPAPCLAASTQQPGLEIKLPSGVIRVNGRVDADLLGAVIRALQ